MDIGVFKGAVGRLKGLIEALPSNSDFYISGHFATDFDNILRSLRVGSSDKFTDFDLPRDAFRNTTHSRQQVQREAVASKSHQLAAYLAAVHASDDKVVEIGSVYNLIRDEELKSRCADLLSARDHFDRVINQATQILEDRVRRKLPEFANDFGLPLFSKAINGEISKSRIVFSNNPSEQDGFAAIFRGLMGAFRNPSHHRFLENVSREQALQICAFIDNMLAALETAELVNP